MPVREIIQKINNTKMLSEIKAKDYADENGYADTIAKASSDLKTTQLRKFFGAVRLIEQRESWDEIEVEFYLLKPKLAAAKGRGLVPDDFFDVMMALMRKVDVGDENEKMKNFDTFINFFESIVAYHKYYNG